MRQAIPLYVLVLLLFSNMAWAQSAYQTPTMTKFGMVAPLHQFTEFLDGQHKIAEDWMIEYGFSAISHPTKTKGGHAVLKDMTVDINLFTDTTHLTGKSMEIVGLAAIRLPLDTVLSKLEGHVNYFSSPDKLPVRFLLKDTNLVFLISVVTDKQFNTLRLTAKQRSSEILSQVLLPSLTALKPLFGNTNIKYYGFSVAYGCKDFSDENAHGEGEVLTLLITSKDCAHFVSGELADQDLLNSADIYVTDKDMRSGFKKIRVTLE